MKNNFALSVSLIGIFLIISILITACGSKGNTEKVKENKVLDTVSFTYSEVSGIGQDSLFNRRDPSDVIKVGIKYYVYYSKMDSPITSGYWATIWYATSEDEGHSWKEQGMALGLGLEGEFDSHSVFTPNILAYDGKYYLFYTAVQPTPGNKNKVFESNSVNDFTAIGLAVANSPDGPFERVSDNPVLEISMDTAAFDSYRIDDASLLIKDDKIWLYYKGRSIIHGIKGPRLTKMGLAFADKAEGPFEKYPEALLDKSHEVLIWKQEGGIASLASINHSINLAPDGINFSPLQLDLENIPKAPGLYRPDLTGANGSVEFPGWGIAMKNRNKKVFLIRFEMK